jgi:hypothetical protein
MSQFYFDQKRASDPYALPDGEVFYADEGEVVPFYDWEPRKAGWYYWNCFPGCLPDGDPVGPFDTEDEAIDAAQESAEWDEDESP